MVSIPFQCVPSTLGDSNKGLLEEKCNFDSQCKIMVCHSWSVPISGI